MQIRSIKTKADHRAALKEIERLMDAKPGTSAGPFKDGLAAVFAETAFGFIDKTGNFVIKPQFAWAFE